MLRRHAKTVGKCLLASVVIAAGLHLAAPLALAQDKHWGVSVTFVPKWEPIPEFYELMYDVSSITGDGNEFRIGLARGSDLGGDWSVAFVRSKISEGTLFDERFPGFGDSGPLIGSFGLARDDLRIEGVKYDAFTPFVTIKERVQVGLVWGVGVGWLKGTIERHDIELDFPPPDFEPVVGDTTVSVVDVKDETDFTTIPLGNVEAGVAILVAPGFKVRLSGGFNFPNTQVFSITGVFLIGSR